MARDTSNQQPKHSSDSDDFGFGSKWTNRTGRFITQDGDFNIIRSGGPWKELHVYQWLVTISWSKFFFLVFFFYFGINAFFAILHLLVGIETLTTTASGSLMEDFSHAFFFSVQTFTTVGYGSISPMGMAANMVAALCALVGLMSFALATGLLFARFSRPTAKVNFSENALIAPYQDGQAFMFRMVNGRKSELINLFIQVTFTWIEYDGNGNSNRKFQRLELERDNVYLFPLNWTIVHPINEESPFYDFKMEKMEAIDAEILIVLSAHDETFGQQVHTKYSYTYKEIVENAKFKVMYHTDEEGRTILELDQLNLFERLGG